MMLYLLNGVCLDLEKLCGGKIMLFLLKKALTNDGIYDIVSLADEQQSLWRVG